MSYRNHRTGRHEDDLYDKIARTGSVPLQELIDHLNEVVVEDVSGLPTNVRTPVKMATLLLEGLIHEGALRWDQEISL